MSRLLIPASEAFYIRPQAIFLASLHQPDSPLPPSPVILSYILLGFSPSRYPVRRGRAVLLAFPPLGWLFSRNLPAFQHHRLGLLPFWKLPEGGPSLSNSYGPGCPWSSGKREGACQSSRAQPLHLRPRPAAHSSRCSWLPVQHPGHEGAGGDSIYTFAATMNDFKFFRAVVFRQKESGGFCQATPLLHGHGGEVPEGPVLVGPPWPSQEGEGSLPHIQA